MDKFNFIDLFSGIGGMRIPFEKLGGRCVFSSEIDKFARTSYAVMFKEDENLINADITKTPAKEIPSHDILLAGFPCQPFSNAGKKKGFKDTRGTLFYEISRIIKFHKPKAFLLENVPGLKSNDGGKTFETIMNILEKELGYFFPDCPTILNSKDFGVPQNRKRLFIVGFKKNVDFSFPSKRNRKTCLSNILEPSEEVKKKYIISGKLWRSHKIRKKRNLAKGKGFGYSLNDEKDSYTRTLSSRYYKDGSEILISRGKQKNPRKLTPKECARLQGFPKKWENLPVSDNQAYRQFGNAVSVPVVKEIAKNMLSALKENEKN